MESNYNLDIAQTVSEVKKSRAKTVCIQLPDGLKPQANRIVDEVFKQTRIKPAIWLGSCFGACDIPLQLSGQFDLLIQFGHTPFIKNSKGWASR